MPTSVHEVFDAFRQAPSNYERGAKFEKLMTQYLPLDPVLRTRSHAVQARYRLVSVRVGQAPVRPPVDHLHH